MYFFFVLLLISDSWVDVNFHIGDVLVVGFEMYLFTASNDLGLDVLWFCPGYMLVIVDVIGAWNTATSDVWVDVANIVDDDLDDDLDLDVLLFCPATC